MSDAECGKPLPFFYKGVTVMIPCDRAPDHLAQGEAHNYSEARIFAAADAIHASIRSENDLTAPQS